MSYLTQNIPPPLSSPISSPISFPLSVLLTVLFTQSNKICRCKDKPGQRKTSSHSAHCSTGTVGQGVAQILGERIPNAPARHTAATQGVYTGEEGHERGVWVLSGAWGEQNCGRRFWCTCERRMRTSWSLSWSLSRSVTYSVCIQILCGWCLYHMSWLLFVWCVCACVSVSGMRLPVLQHPLICLQLLE